MTGYHRYGPDEDVTGAMYEMYQDGASCADVGEAFGVTRQAVYGRFKSAGLELRPRYGGVRRPVQRFRGEKFTPGDHGYYRSTSSRDGRLLHRVMWEHYRGPIPDGWDVHHKNGDKHDNRIENLDCMPKAEHTRHHWRERREDAA